MKPLHRIAIAAVISAAFGFVAGARADVSVHIDISHAPPAPRIAFHAEPHMVYEPEDRVYVVDDPGEGDADCFHYGPYWYAFSAGYWYRSRTWHGSFIVVSPGEVPVAIYHVPRGRWRHHPVYTAMRVEKRHEHWRNHERHEGREHVRGEVREKHEGEGHGHGRGHDRDGDKGRDRDGDKGHGRDGDKGRD